MKKYPFLAYISICLSLFAYTSYLISWDAPEISVYRTELERLTGRRVSGTYNVVLASSAGEFSRLSRLGYWMLAGSADNTIYLQPLSLIPNLPRTLAHEMTHIYLAQFSLPYWLEEGLVCTVTGEWIGRHEKLLGSVEELDYTQMDFMTYRAFSYSCWRRVGELLRIYDFNELVLNYSRSNSGSVF